MFRRATGRHLLAAVELTMGDESIGLTTFLLREVSAFEKQFPATGPNAVPLAAPTRLLLAFALGWFGPSLGNGNRFDRGDTLRVEPVGSESIDSRAGVGGYENACSSGAKSVEPTAVPLVQVANSRAKAVVREWPCQFSGDRIRGAARRNRGVSAVVQAPAFGMCTNVISGSRSRPMPLRIFSQETTTRGALFSAGLIRIASEDVQQFASDRARGIAPVHCCLQYRSCS